MATKLDICNSALVKIGSEPLIDVADGSKAGKLVDTRYEHCRDYVLREHPWKCAIKRVALSPVYSPPAPLDADGNPLYNPNQIPLSDPASIQQYQYAYNFPSDFLRLVVNDDSKLRGYIEGRQILSNLQNLVIRYVWQVDDASILDSMLSETIAWYLGADISMALIQNTNVTNMANKQYQLFLSKAKFTDASTSKAISQNEYFYEEVRLQANHL